MNWRDCVATDPMICHGQAGKKGTRIPVSVVLGNLAAGLYNAAIVERYPALSTDAIRAATAVRCRAFAGACHPSFGTRRGVRFKVDENLPQDVADLLNKAGQDAISVLDQALGGETDPRVHAVCRYEDRTLITRDLDFSSIQENPRADSAGILVLRLPRQDKASVLAVAERLLPVLDSGSLEKALWIVEEDRIRIRR